MPAARSSVALPVLALAALARWCLLEEMKRIAVLSVAYLLGAAASDAAPKQYPVTKAAELAAFAPFLSPSRTTRALQVVNLLKDMQKKLEEEAEKDEEVDEKMKCWCKACLLMLVFPSAARSVDMPCLGLSALCQETQQSKAETLGRRATSDARCDIFFVAVQLSCI